MRKWFRKMTAVLLVVVMMFIMTKIVSTSVGAISAVIENALQWAIGIANDNRHLYVYGGSHGSEGLHYDCSSFVSWALVHAGLDVPISTTDHMRENFKPYGFEWIPWSSIGGTANLKRGDILLNEVEHVEFYLGDNTNVGAHTSKKPAADQISVSGYYNHPWDGVLRYKDEPVHHWYDDYTPEYLGEWFLGRIEHQPSGVSLSSVNENVLGIQTNDSMEQMWWFVRNSDGSYRIQNLVDEKYIHVWGSADDNNTNVISYGDYTGESNQNFFIYKINEHYCIRPSYSEKLWSIKEWGDYNVTIWDKVDTSTSEWFNIIRVTADRRMPQDLGSDFYAKIKHRSSDVYLTNQNNGIFGHEMTGAQNQIWHFVRQSNLSYSVQSVCDESYIQVQNALDVNDTRLVSQSSVTEANHQRFFIYVMDNGGYCFKPLYTDKIWSMKEWDDYYMSIWDKVENSSPQTFDIISTEYAKPLIGDTNLDGAINISDVTALQRHLADLTTLTDSELAAADANGDGEINIVDATHLQKYLAEFNVALGKQS